MMFLSVLQKFVFLCGNYSAENVVLYMINLAAIVAIVEIEERFLFRYGEYASYAQRVPYRFIPGVY